MSISEMERLAKDLQNDEAILEEVRDVGADNQAVVRFANAKGYDFTLEEVEAIVAKSGELSDEQLESVAGLHPPDRLPQRILIQGRCFRQSQGRGEAGFTAPGNWLLGKYPQNRSFTVFLGRVIHSIHRVIHGFVNCPLQPWRKRSGCGSIRSSRTGS